MLKARGLMLHSGTVIDATIIAAPSLTKNSSGKRDPEMHQTKKGNQWHYGMKSNIGSDAESGLVHSPVWIHQGALPCPGQEHSTAIYALRALQPLDGEKALPTGNCGMSAPEIGQSTDTGGENTAISMERVLNSSTLKTLVSLCGILSIKAVSAVSFGHHP